MIHIPKNKIACEPIFDPDKTASGRLYIPDTAKERCDQGIVKYIGPEVDWICPGDHVLFSGYTGALVSLEGEGLLIILPADFVTAIIKSPDYDIPGLYFRDEDGEYFTATYEMAITLIARGLEDSEWYKNLVQSSQEKGHLGWVTAGIPSPKEHTWR